MNPANQTIYNFLTIYQQGGFDNEIGFVHPELALWMLSRLPKERFDNLARRVEVSWPGWMPSLEVKWPGWKPSFDVRWPGWMVRLEVRWPSLQDISSWKREINILWISCIAPDIHKCRARCTISIGSGSAISIFSKPTSYFPKTLPRWEWAVYLRSSGEVAGAVYTWWPRCTWWPPPWCTLSTSLWCTWWPPPWCNLPSPQECCCWFSFGKLIPTSEELLLLFLKATGL